MSLIAASDTGIWQDVRVCMAPELEMITVGIATIHDHIQLLPIEANLLLQTYYPSYQALLVRNTFQNPWSQRKSKCLLWTKDIGTEGRHQKNAKIVTQTKRKSLIRRRLIAPDNGSALDDWCPFCSYQRSSGHCLEPEGLLLMVWPNVIQECITWPPANSIIVTTSTLARYIAMAAPLRREWRPSSEWSKPKVSGLTRWSSARSFSSRKVPARQDSLPSAEWMVLTVV